MEDVSLDKMIDFVIHTYEDCKNKLLLLEMFLDLVDIESEIMEKGVCIYFRFNNLDDEAKESLPFSDDEWVMMYPIPDDRLTDLIDIVFSM